VRRVGSSRSRHWQNCQKTSRPIVSPLVYRPKIILGGILAGFIVLEQLIQGFDLWHSVQAELLEVAGKAIHQSRLWPSSWLNPLGFCLAFGLFWMMWSMAPLKTMSHAASLAITSARILVAVEISPSLSAIKPSRIYCLTFSSCSVVMHLLPAPSESRQARA
jgi:hypothetical protein